jgi:adenylate kinase
MKAIVFSPPGAGKGTQCSWLSKETGVTHISSGDLLRSQIAQGTDLGRSVTAYTRGGDLVPDELIFDLLMPVVIGAVRETGGYLLDGFPRTVPQATRLAQLTTEKDLTPDVVIYLTAPDDVLVERLLDRARREDRPDDDPEVIRHRLIVFGHQTAPLLTYYRAHGGVCEIDADRPVADVRADLGGQLAALGLLANWSSRSEAPSAVPTQGD